jgi:DNA mismatch repair protein MutS
MRARLLRPIADVAVLKTRLDRIDEMAGMEPAAIERGLRGLYDMTRLFRKLELGTATLTDMSCLLRSYEATGALIDAAATATPMTPAREYLAWIAARWDTTTVIELVRDGATVPTISLPWATGVYPAVEEAFAQGTKLYAAATAICQRWSALGRGEPLYLDVVEGGGFRITGTKRRITAVHAALASGSEQPQITPYKSSAALETPELTALSARHRKWCDLWTGVWTDAWAVACQEIVDRGAVIHKQLEEWCAELDVSWTVSCLAREWLWIRPTFDADAAESYVVVKGMRHAILERIHTQIPYVKHSVGLSPIAPTTASDITWSTSGLLLYGMNASGKSSLMKALGLCVLLAQAGFPVPATSFHLAPFTAIFTRILGNDNLWAGLSSFAVEMTEFREILRYADERSLVLGDELCSGTESLSATALVAAGVEFLSRRRTKFIFATHLHELATLPDIAGLSGVHPVHLRVHYDPTADLLVYDRNLAPGSGSALYGLEVCRALDLPTGYLDRAVALRQTLAGWQAPKASSYSVAAIVESCQVCGSTKGLETHHIRPQAEAAKARAEGLDVHSASNLVCLCAACHDDHHAGRLDIQRWEETSAGLRLIYQRPMADADPVAPAPALAPTLAGLEPSSSKEEITGWIRDQKRHRVRIATIQRTVKQLFGVDMSDKDIRAIRLT